MSTVFRCSSAWVGGALKKDIDILVDSGGVITDIVPSDPWVRPLVTSLSGVVYPGFANAHSHAFHRALRGRTHSGGGNFWTWRDQMYALSSVLDPDSYYGLARAVYAEMVLAGITCVGEFHYLHHAPGGVAYADANAMGEALRHAASDAGLRLTLLDTCYVSGGLASSGHIPLNDNQLRFGDRDAQAWADRVAGLAPDVNTRIGVAVHSVRAVPREQLSFVAQEAAGKPIHVHLSEQIGENEACESFYGMTPTQLLDSEGVLGSLTTVVHATHLSSRDIEILGAAGGFHCFCPTTERDLADGIGPAMELCQAGSTLCLGSDQHAVIDMFEEMRGVEMHERLVHHERGRFSSIALISAATKSGHESLGWDDAGEIRIGNRADFVCVPMASVRTAGSDPEQSLLSTFASDIDTVVIGGQVVVSAGEHRAIDVAAELNRSIVGLWNRVKERA